MLLKLVSTTAAEVAKETGIAALIDFTQKAVEAAPAVVKNYNAEFSHQLVDTGDQLVVIALEFLHPLKNTLRIRVGLIRLCEHFCQRQKAVEAAPAVVKNYNGAIETINASKEYYTKLLEATGNV